jgi:hypothetical protein
MEMLCVLAIGFVIAGSTCWEFYGRFTSVFGSMLTGARSGHSWTEPHLAYALDGDATVLATASHQRMLTDVHTESFS